MGLGYIRKKTYNKHIRSMRLLSAREERRRKSNRIVPSKETKIDDLIANVVEIEDVIEAIAEEKEKEVAIDDNAFGNDVVLNDVVPVDEVVVDKPNRKSRKHKASYETQEDAETIVNSDEEKNF